MLVITIKLKTECVMHATAMLLFYVPHKFS